MATKCRNCSCGGGFTPPFSVVGSPRDMFEHTRSNQRRQHKCQQHGPRINRKSPLFHWSQCLSLFAHSVSPSLANRSNVMQTKLVNFSFVRAHAIHPLCWTETLPDLLRLPTQQTKEL